VDHDGPHPSARPAPLGRPGLQAQTERAPLAHCVFGGRYTSMISDLPVLRGNGDPAHVPAIGRIRLTEIEDGLKALTADFS